jgi:hypothetical protein
VSRRVAHATAHVDRRPRCALAQPHSPRFRSCSALFASVRGLGCGARLTCTASRWFPPLGRRPQGGICVERGFVRCSGCWRSHRCRAVAALCRLVCIAIARLRAAALAARVNGALCAGEGAALGEPGVDGGDQVAAVVVSDHLCDGLGGRGRARRPRRGRSSIGLLRGRAKAARVHRDPPGGDRERSLPRPDRHAPVPCPAGGRGATRRARDLHATFAERGKHTWPPDVTVFPSWPEGYRALAAEEGFKPADVKQAAEDVRQFIREIDQADEA